MARDYSALMAIPPPVGNTPTGRQEHRAAQRPRSLSRAPGRATSARMARLDPARLRVGSLPLRRVSDRQDPRYLRLRSAR